MNESNTSTLETSSVFGNPRLQTDEKQCRRNDSTLYDSALENITTFASFDEMDLRQNNEIPKYMTSNELLSESGRHDGNAIQEEVNPKSQLANKTVFKNDNPNLSIIEINQNSSREQELKNSIILIEPYDDENAHALNSIYPQNYINVNGKSRKKPTLLKNAKQNMDAVTLEEQKLIDENICAENLSRDTRKEIKLYESLDEFENNLPSTVTILNTPFGSKVYLVGTAHFSEDSQDDVSYVIRNVRPDVVMVELCPSRIHILKLDEKSLLEEAKSFNLTKIRSIIQTHGYINGIFFILLLQMSAQIAKDLGMAPGGEFRRAFEEIHKIPGCMLHLGDRPIRITLHRALRALSLWQTIKLVWRLTSSDTISIEEVEECKQRDLLEKLMQEMAGEFPAFSDVFVRERDIFLCHSLQLAALPQPAINGSGIPRPVRVVGVVGIGHANGIAQMWGKVDPQKIPEILEIPPASSSTRMCKYIIKYGLIGLTLFGVVRVLKPRLIRLF
ncbi:traB domain-containing protein isoform X2 [Teleopsis dalmanni]|uniref:traB domain-containing protein isoform X2 n=1 Tax=Teleopsis dalmanni TaxID=139649 RepID=UPI0018CFE7B9|nr:traB domain-containing protein isoform X2 [Teleopsis dalmanni]